MLNKDDYRLLHSYSYNLAYVPKQFVEETFKNFVIPLIQSWTLMSKEKGEKLMYWNMSKQVVEDEEQVTNNYSEHFMLEFNHQQANVKTFKKAVTNLNRFTSFEETQLKPRTRAKYAMTTPL